MFFKKKERKKEREKKERSFVFWSFSIGRAQTEKKRRHASVDPCGVRASKGVLNNRGKLLHNRRGRRRRTTTTRARRRKPRSARAQRNNRPTAEEAIGWWQDDENRKMLTRKTMHARDRSRSLGLNPIGLYLTSWKKEGLRLFITGRLQEVVLYKHKKLTIIIIWRFSLSRLKTYAATGICCFFECPFDLQWLSFS